MNTYHAFKSGITFTSTRADIRYVLAVKGDDGVWRVRNRSARYEPLVAAARKAEAPFIAAGYGYHETPFRIESVERLGEG